MLAAVARRAGDRQIACPVAKRRVNMLQRSRPAVNRRAAIVATGPVGKDGGYIGGCQFGAAIAPIGKVGPIAMPRHDIFTTIVPVIGALVAQMLVGHKGYFSKRPGQSQGGCCRAGAGYGGVLAYGNMTTSE